MLSSPSAFYTGQFRTGSYPDNPDTGSFVSIWNTTKTSAGSSTAAQITLPLESTGTYNFIVDWGDNSTSTITVWNQAQTTHTYTTPGVYKIKITGTCYGWRFNNTGDRLKFISVQQWGTGFRLGNSSANFHGCGNLLLDYVRDVLDLTGTTTFASLFASCTSLRGVGRINEWNTVNITSLDSTFAYAYNFNDDIGNWNTENVTNMNSTFLAGVFNTTVGRFNRYIGNWNTSKVTTMGSMFQNQHLFNQDISTKAVTVNGVTYTAWDTLNVTNMNSIFQTSVTGFYAKFNQNIGNWNTSKVINMGRMFNDANDFNQDISTKEVTVNGVTYTAWDTKEVIDMGLMFSSQTSRAGVFNQYIGNWNTSKLTSLLGTFQLQPLFNQDINTKEVTVNGVTYTAWDVKNVTNMTAVFNAGSGRVGYFNQPIGNWNTSKVTTARTMFQNQYNFNQDIGTKAVTVGSTTYTAWDTKEMTDISYMFFTTGLGYFNNGNSDSIKNWNTSKVTTLFGTFYNKPYFNQDLSTKTVTINAVTYTAWSTTLTTTLGYAFGISLSAGGNGSFNGNVSNWDTSKVTSMAGLFERQVLFNQALNSWNTAKVTNMGDMFNLATSFNQPIGNWVVSGVTTFVDDAIEGFMAGKTDADYSAANYDALLIGWASRPVLANKLINFGTIKYTSAAVAARTILTSAPNNWTILDGGLL